VSGGYFSAYALGKHFAKIRSIGKLAKVVAVPIGIEQFDICVLNLRSVSTQSGGTDTTGDRTSRLDHVCSRRFACIGYHGHSFEVVPMVIRSFALAIRSNVKNVIPT